MDPRSDGASKLLTFQSASGRSTYVNLIPSSVTA